MALPTRVELVELDIDTRLAALWAGAENVDEWTLEIVGAYIRAAYGLGYTDALVEDPPRQLYRDHGYPFPHR